MTEQNDTLTRLRLANPADEADPNELAELLAAIDAEIAVPPSRRRGPTLRWQPRPALVAAVALVVTLAMFLPLRYLGERDDGAVAATTPPPSTVATSVSQPSSLSPVAPVLPLSVDPTELRWRRVDMPGLSGAYLYFDTVIAGGPGLIAVGSPNRSDDFIWTSEDGVDWTPASVDRPGYAFDVTAGGPGYVAVGSSIWVSSNGVSWSEAVFNDPIVGEVRAVTVGGPGLVAVGTFNYLDRAWIYTSADGLQWSLIPQEGAPEVQYESGLSDIVAGGPGLVAVGQMGGSGAVWTSPDGVEWTRVPHDSEVFGHGGSEATELHSIAADGSGFVAVGRTGVWRSSNGLDWSVVSLGSDVLSEIDELHAVISTEQGFIAAGVSAGGVGGVWFSPDGITWTRLQTAGALGGADIEGISDVTVFGDSVVAVGWEYTRIVGSEESIDSEVVWIGEPARE